MWSKAHYVPVLKGKLGEFDGLEKVTDEVAASVTPLLEVEPIPLTWDRKAKTSSLSATLEHHLERWATRYYDAWKRRPAFIDADALGDDIDDRGDHCVERLFKELRKLKANVVPVARLTSRTAAVAALRRVHTIDESGVCVRVTEAEIKSATFTSSLRALLKSLRLQAEAIDCVIDAGSVKGAKIAPLVSRWVRVVNTAAGAGNWRTFTLAASSFPEVAGLNGVELFPRVEATAWSRLAGRKPDRVPTFGDFGVQGPDWPDTSSPPWPGNACIRYTARKRWLVVRGGPLNKPGTKNGDLFRHVAKILVARPEYRGPTYSWGSERIDACARGAPKLATASIWRGIGANQHITFVSTRLATKGAP